MGDPTELHANNGPDNTSIKNAVSELEKRPHVVETVLPSADERDAQALARLGKKPVLKVGCSW